MELLQTVSNGLIEVLSELPGNYYTQPIAVLDHQSIGQQVRHIAEHWKILADNYDTAYINYGDRKRDKTIEQQKYVAIDVLRQLQESSSKKDISLQVASMDTKKTFNSTYFRELDNVAEHIIHHAAIIRIAILSIAPEFRIPEDFGYAPSTISYKQGLCVQ